MEIEIVNEAKQREEREKRLQPLMEPEGIYGANGYFLTRDGKPWYPVMGEIHFSRLKESLWRDAVAKMKAGGVQVLATYVFWIHHEERQGEWDFTGQRDLRKFLAVCQEGGMPVRRIPGLADREGGSSAADQRSGLSGAGGNLLAAGLPAGGWILLPAGRPHRGNPD